MTTEIELKYLLLPTADTQSATNIPEKITQILTQQGYAFKTVKKDLANYYLDTPNLNFRQLDMGLRVRTTKIHSQSLRHEQTIKTAGEVIGGLHKRPEYNVELNDNNVRLALFPKSIWQGTNINLDELQQAIIPLFITNFARVTWTISLGQSVIELAFDHGIIYCDGLDKVDIIDEIELELLTGEQQDLLVLARLLLAHFSMRFGRVSKAARGYALAAQLVKLNLAKQMETDSDDIEQNNLAVTTIVNTTAVILLPAVKPLNLDIIPGQDHQSTRAAFCYGLGVCLTKLQANIDNYLETQVLSDLFNINELLALIRQGFWLFEQELTPKQLTLRDELSYFIRTLDWLDNAQQLEELINLSPVYRKKFIVELQQQKNSVPSQDSVVEFLYSERFNLLQLSLLELLLTQEIADTDNVLARTDVLTFAQVKLTESVANTSRELLTFDGLSQTSLCLRYLEINGLLVRSLLTASWFSGLFNKKTMVNINEQSTDNYSLLWLDIKQGINELATLSQLQQQLLANSFGDEKLLVWLSNKIENLLQAMEQSRVKALSMKPYWQGSL